MSGQSTSDTWLQDFMAKASPEQQKQMRECLRDDNPFEYGWWAIYKGGTISQNISIYIVVLGVVLMVIFEKIRLKVDEPEESRKIQALVNESNET